MIANDLDIALIADGLYPIVSVKGELDHLGIDRFERIAQQAADLDLGVVILSLVDAAYFDSLTVHAIMAYRARLEANRQRLVVAVRERGTPRRILDIVGVTTRVPTYPTLEAAIAAAPELTLRKELGTKNQTT